MNVVTDVVKSEIPILLSKESMKKAGTKIDFVSHKVIIYGKETSLQFTSNGHYAILLNDYHKDLKLSIVESKLTEVLLTIDNIEKKSYDGKSFV